MLSLSPLLALLAALFLIDSCALARSIKDEASQKEAEMLSAENSYRDPRKMADLLDYFLTYRHLIPDDQSAYRLSGAKRSWNGRFLVPSSMKRRMFWTPLGHLPASARLGRPQALRPNMEDSGSNVFRYG